MAARPAKQLAELLSEAKRLLRRGRRRLDPHARAEVAAIVGMAESALASGDGQRAEAARKALSEVAERHLVAFRKSTLREIVEVVALAVAIALLWRAVGFEAFRIPSGSMAPTLVPGDVVLVSKSAYGLQIGGLRLLTRKGPARGDVIVFDSRLHGGETMIKRVAGVAGDRIEVVDGQVVVNGAPQPRELVRDRYEYWNYSQVLSYWHRRSGELWIEELDGRRHATLRSRLLPRGRPKEGPFLVPAGHVFVLGDNRDESDDGRTLGGWYVPVDAIRGRAARIAVSWGQGGLPLLGEEGPRLDRIFRPLDAGVPAAETLHQAAEAMREAGAGPEDEGMEGGFLAR